MRARFLFRSRPFHTILALLHALERPRTFSYTRTGPSVSGTFHTDANLIARDRPRGLGLPRINRNSPSPRGLVRSAARRVAILQMASGLMCSATGRWMLNPYINNHILQMRVRLFAHRSFEPVIAREVVPVPRPNRVVCLQGCSLFVSHSVISNRRSHKMPRFPCAGQPRYRAYESLASGPGPERNYPSRNDVTILNGKVRNHLLSNEGVLLLLRALLLVKKHRTAMPSDRHFGGLPPFMSSIQPSREARFPEL